MITSVSSQKESNKFNIHVQEDREAKCRAIGLKRRCAIRSDSGTSKSAAMRSTLIQSAKFCAREKEISENALLHFEEIRTEQCTICTRSIRLRGADIIAGNKKRLRDADRRRLMRMMNLILRHARPNVLLSLLFIEGHFSSRRRASEQQ